ncbi:MAG: DNA polymerase III subunit gamma/tau [Candidatus Zixiibacteriota bacterium]
MSEYLALARKWRPQTFDDVIAQPQVTQTLKNAIAAGRIHHAYLFCGPRGTGKTTTARILAKALNCEQGPTPTPCNQCGTCMAITQGNCLDVLEIDAASNTGIDDVRELRESSRLVPAGARFKVYIIDEVHRLSKNAFDALLKTLEEPPPSVKFIFATTEVHDVPPTVRSRALRFDFRLIPQVALRGQLEKIAQAEGIAVEPEALDIIAAEAAGSLRDSQSLLDQIASYAGGPITAALTNEALGLVDSDMLFALTDAFAAADAQRALDVIGQVARAGRDLSQFVRQLAEHLKRLLFARSLGDEYADEALNADQQERYRRASTARDENDWLRLLLMAVELAQRVRRGSAQPLLEIEMFAMRAARLDRSIDIRSLVERLERQTSIPGLARAAEHDAGPALPLPDRGSEDENASTPPRDPVAQAPASPPVGDMDFAPILESICHHRPTLRAVLGHAQLVETGAGGFELNVYNGSTFHQRQLAEKPVRDLIHAEITKAVGAGARISIHVKEGPAPARSALSATVTAPSGGPEPAGLNRSARDEKIRSDHAVQEILRRFDGEIVE